MPEVHELKRSLGLTPGEPLGPFTVREVEVSQCVVLACFRGKGGKGGATGRGGDGGLVACLCTVPAAQRPPRPHLGPFSFPRPRLLLFRYRPAAFP